MNFDKLLSLVELALIATLIAVLATAAVLPPRACSNASVLLKMRTQWVWSAGGCFIEHKPGRWIPLNAYRVVEGRSND